MDIIPFETEHIQLMDLRGYELSYGMENLKISHDRNMGPGFTLRHEGKIIGSAGISILWPGVGEGWAIISNLIYKYPLLSHRATKKGLNLLIKKRSLHRVQADILKGFYDAERWVKSLGFKFESEMLKYGTNGDTYMRYARIS